MVDLIVVDSDILIDAGRGVGIAVTRLQALEAQSPLAVSVITQMELFVGCRNSLELQQVQRFLKRFVVLKLNEHISDAAVDLLQRYRLSHGLLVADALIAATAVAIDALLVSKNQRDYQFVKYLRQSRRLEFGNR